MASFLIVPTIPVLIHVNPVIFDNVFDFIKRLGGDEKVEFATAATKCLPLLDFVLYQILHVNLTDYGLVTPNCGYCRSKPANHIWLSVEIIFMVDSDVAITLFFVVEHLHD